MDEPENNINNFEVDDTDSKHEYESIKEVELGSDEDVGGLCCRFRIKWSVAKEDFVKAKELSYYSIINFNESCGNEKCSKGCGHTSGVLNSSATTGDELQVVRSKLFNLASIGNIRFHLELGFSKDRYHVAIHRDTNDDDDDDNVELQYAFIALRNRVYQLAHPIGSNTLRSIQERPLNYSELFNHINVLYPKRFVDIHLMIKVYADMSMFEYGFSNIDSSKLNLENLASNLLEPHKKDPFDSYLDKLSFRNELWRFWNGGELPVLDVEKAKLLITSSRVLNVDVFRALGVEYLIHRLNKNTVIDLMAFSIINKIECLRNACFEFLFKKCKIVRIDKKNEHISFV